MDDMNVLFNLSKESSQYLIAWDHQSTYMVKAYVAHMLVW